MAGSDISNNQNCPSLTISANHLTLMALATSSKEQVVVRPEQSIPSSFPQFRLLPTELQLRIWHFHLPAPRKVTIRSCFSESFQERTLNDRSSSSDPHASISVRTSSEILWPPYSSYADAQLLHVSHQLSRLVLQRYSKTAEHSLGWYKRYAMFSSASSCEKHSPFALLNPRCDILVLQDASNQCCEPPLLEPSAIEILVRGLKPKIVAMVRRLAIAYPTWRKARVTGSLKILLDFKALEELWILCLAWYRLDGQILRDRNGVEIDQIHWDEIKFSVETDVREMKIESPGWGNGMSLGFVRDESCLTDKLEV